MTECWRADLFCWVDKGLLAIEDVAVVVVFIRDGFWTFPADIDDRSGWIPAVPLVELNWKYLGSIFELTGGLSELNKNQFYPIPKEFSLTFVR